MNHLSGWDQSVDPHAWQPLPTVLERHHTNRRVLTISLGKYRGTGTDGGGAAWRRLRGRRRLQRPRHLRPGGTLQPHPDHRVPVLGRD